MDKKANYLSLFFNKKCIKYPIIVIVILASSRILIEIIARTMVYFQSIGALPSYTCEDGRTTKMVIQGGDGVMMCNQGEFYKERIKYYK